MLPKCGKARFAVFNIDAFPVSFSLPFSVFNVVRGGLLGPPSQRALERRVVMKEAIDFFVDFKGEAFFIPSPLWVSGLGSALGQTCGL